MNKNNQLPTVDKTIRWLNLRVAIIAFLCFLVKRPC